MLQEFGLGVIIQATDKASQVFGQVSSSFTGMQSTIAGGTQAISRDMQTMAEIMTASVVGHTLQNVGENFIAKGKGMMDWVVNFAKGIIGVGDSVDKTRITLGALYKSAEAGQQKLDEIVQYALKTPFEIQSLTSIVTMFKAIGIEAIGAGSAVTSTKGKTREFLDVMSDLASLQPQVPFNMAAYAVKEYVAEGNTISLLRRMSLDIRNILGRELGDTIEERKKDMADLVEILGAEGLTDKLFGTWTQAMSNFSDFFFNMKTAIADAGMFQSLKDTLLYVGGIAQGLDPEVVKRFAKAMSDGFLYIFKPIDKVVRKLAEFAETVVKYIGDNPWVTKLAFGFTTVASAIAIASGFLLVLAGTALVLTAGLRMFTSGLMARQFAGFGLAVKGSLFFLAKFIAIAGLIYYAWNTNFLGIQDKVKAFGIGIAEVYEGISVGLDLNGRALVLWVERLENSESVYDRFAGKVLKVVEVIKGLIDVFSDGRLDEDNFRALTDLGLIDIIADALEAKRNVELFLEGLETGFQKSKDFITPIIDTLREKFQEFKDFMVDEFLPVFGIYIEEEDKAMDFTKVKEKRKEVEELGEKIGMVLSALSLLWAASKVIGIIGGLLKPIVGTLKGISGGISAISIALGISVGWILLIIGVIVVLGILYYKFEAVRTVVKTVIAIVVALGVAFVLLLVIVAGVIATIIAVITTIVVVFAGIIATIIGAWNTAWGIIKDVVSGVIETIYTILWYFVTGRWGEIGDKLKEIWGEKWDSIKGRIDGFVKDFKETWNGVKTFLTGLWSGLYTPIGEFFSWVGKKFDIFLEKLGLAKSELGSVQSYNPKGQELINQYNPAGSHIYNQPPTKAVIKPTTSGKNTAYDVGSRFIPYDMRASVHKGEMIVPKKENPYANSDGKILPFLSRQQKQSPESGANYDLSVTFAEGAIVLNVKDTSPDEAKRLAEQIMKYIDRKKDLENIRRYKRGVIQHG